MYRRTISDEHTHQGIHQAGGRVTRTLIEANDLGQTSGRLPPPDPGGVHLVLVHHVVHLAQ